MEINISLNPQEIAKCSKTLENLANSLESQKLDLHVKHVAENALESVSKGFFGDEATTFLENDGIGSYSVVAEGEKVKFIEFGTGVVGESGSYQGKLPSDWEYDARWTPVAHDYRDPTYWYYYDDMHIKHRTNGDLPRSVMLNGAREARKTIKKEFGDIANV